MIVMIWTSEPITLQRSDISIKNETLIIYYILLYENLIHLWDKEYFVSEWSKSITTENGLS